jgi:aryl-alcohol dehydrogenase-like predicted oxidoreductase
MHRMDPSTPIEGTMRTLKALVEEGKIRYVGLSECTPDELRRAHSVHPVTAIQMEWSLQTRDIEKDVVPVARELGIAIVPYSPLGRGFLADIANIENMDEHDWRRSNPRFSGENYEENKKRIARYFDIAKRKGCTGAQLALAWIHLQGEDVFPIPGTKSSARIEENAKAFLVTLTEEEKREIEEVVHVLGDRYPEPMMKATYHHRL